MSRPGRAAALAFAGYCALSVLLTWPLARGLTRDLPSDLGDPVLNVFILGWDLRCLDAGAPFVPSAWQQLWNAPIFHPETLTLAYSEHLFGQALLAWPLHALGAGPVLVYNTLFLASFALSALGAFLLSRELTGSSRAGLLGGLFFGFALYRFGQLSHLQVLSSYPLPFVLFGLSRHARTGSRAALLGAASALWLQNLSNGYYLVLFTPFAALWAVAALAWNGRLRERRAWIALALAGLLVAALTWPFVRPYVEVRQRGVIQRERGEVQAYAPDALGYLTAPATLRLWGPRLRFEPQVEAALFPGLAPIALALVGLVAAWPGAPPGAGSTRERLASGLLSLSALLAVLAVPLVAGRSLELVGLRLASPTRPMTLAALAVVAALRLSARLRAALRALLLSPAGFLVLALVVSVWLSLGPRPRALGALLRAPSLYGLLYDHLPGFDSLRVPGRIALLVALWLALLAALGAARLLARRTGAQASALTTVLVCAFLVESWAVPLPINRPFAALPLHSLPERLPLGEATPGIYAEVALLPASAVLLELPLGVDAYELRYMAAALEHGRPLVNGFSGGVSSEHRALRVALRKALAEPQRAQAALASSSATHVVVHTGAWGRERYGERLVAWLEGLGARTLAARDGDVLLQLEAR